MFKDISLKVKEKAEIISNWTLDKLKEMNPDIASHLWPNIPNYEDLKWSDVFKKIWIDW